LHLGTHVGSIEHVFDQSPGDEYDRSLAALCGVVHAATA
jgi:hypothetical protein